MVKEKKTSKIHKTKKIKFHELINQRMVVVNPSNEIILDTFDVKSGNLETPFINKIFVGTKAEITAHINSKNLKVKDYGNQN